MLNIRTFEKRFPERKLLHNSLESKVYRVYNKICKLHKDEECLTEEWSNIKMANEIMRSPYLSECIMDPEFKMLVWPVFEQVEHKKDIDIDKLYYDIKGEIEILLENRLIHLDVSIDNILYDIETNRYMLCDYANMSLFNEIKEYIAEYPEEISEVAYKKDYQNPLGFDRYGDMYALNICIEKLK